MKRRWEEEKRDKNRVTHVYTLNDTSLFFAPPRLSTLNAQRGGAEKKKKKKKKEGVDAVKWRGIDVTRNRGGGTVIWQLVSRR